jgi:hypothetical protein
VRALRQPLLKALARMRNGIGSGDAAGVEAEFARFRCEARLEVCA